jgi:hypothetical protein
MNDNAIGRLLKLGWLVASNSRHYRIWHDRLLNWAVAEGIVGAVRDGRLAVPDALVKLRTLHYGPWDSARSLLGYVIMDVLWIALHPGNGMVEFAAQILPILERSS